MTTGERSAPAPCSLVLGASGALGRAVAKAFRGAGHRVLSTGFRNQPESEPAFQLDATQPGQADALAGWVAAQTGRLDAIVHCIGRNADSLLARMTDQAWQEVLDANLKSAFLVSRALLPQLLRQRQGHFIFVASWAAQVGRAGQGNYAAAKAGLIAFSRCLAREYAGRGIRANVIVPGVFPSPLTEKLTRAALEELWAGAALQGLADLGETSRFIVQLASLKDVTGQVFHLDGRIPPF